MPPGFCFAVQIRTLWSERRVWRTDWTSIFLFLLAFIGLIRGQNPNPH
jgi:hypothetical protein